MPYLSSRNISIMQHTKCVAWTPKHPVDTLFHTHYVLSAAPAVELSTHGARRRCDQQRSESAFTAMMVLVKPFGSILSHGPHCYAIASGILIDMNSVQHEIVNRTAETYWNAHLTEELLKHRCCRWCPSTPSILTLIRCKDFAMIRKRIFINGLWQSDRWIRSCRKP